MSQIALLLLVIFALSVCMPPNVEAGPSGYFNYYWTLSDAQKTAMSDECKGVPVENCYGYTVPEAGKWKGEKVDRDVHKLLGETKGGKKISIHFKCIVNVRDCVVDKGSVRIAKIRGI